MCIRDRDTGMLTQGEVIALVNYMNQILVALIALANLIITASKAWASAARVNEVFDTPSTMKEGERQVFTTPFCLNPFWWIRLFHSK